MGFGLQSVGIILPRRFWQPGGEGEWLNTGGGFPD